NLTYSKYQKKATGTIPEGRASAKVSHSRKKRHHENVFSAVSIWAALSHSRKFQANGAVDINSLSRVGEQSRILVSLEDHDIIRILVSGQQEVSRRINDEISGRLPQGRLTTGVSEFTILSYRENGDLVRVAAVG